MTTKKTKAERLFTDLRICAERTMMDWPEIHFDAIDSRDFKDECFSTRTCNAVQKEIDRYNTWTEIFDNISTPEDTAHRNEVARIIQNTLDNQRKAIAEFNAI